MALLFKAFAGGLIVILISFLARSRSYYIAGLVPLFPTFTLIAHYAVGTTRTPAELKATVLFTMLSMIPYMLYLSAMYVLAERVRLETALACATGIWLIAACVLVAWWVRMA